MLVLAEAVRSGDVFDFRLRNSRDAVIASAEDKLQPSGHESIDRRPAAADERGDEEGALFTDSSPSVDGNHHQETTATGRSHRAAAKDNAERGTNASGDAATTTTSSTTTKTDSASLYNRATVVSSATTASSFPVATALGDFFECCVTRGTVRMRRTPAGGRKSTAADGSKLVRHQKQSKMNSTMAVANKSDNFEMVELLQDGRHRLPTDSDMEQVDVVSDCRRRAVEAALRDVDRRPDGDEGRLPSASSRNRQVDGSAMTAAGDDRRINIRKYASRFQSRHRQRLLQQQQQQQQKPRDYRSSCGEAPTACKSDVRLVVMEGGEHVRAELVRRRRRRSGVSDYNEVDNGADDDEQQLVVVTPRAHPSPTVLNGSPVHRDTDTSDLGGVTITSNRKEAHEGEWGRAAVLSSGDEATPDGWSPASSCRHPKTDDSPASGNELFRRAGDTSGFRRLLDSTGSRGSGCSEGSIATAPNRRAFGCDGVIDTTSQRHQDDDQRSPEAETSPEARDDVVKRRQQTRFCGQRLWSSRRRQRESRADDSITSRQVTYTDHAVSVNTSVL
jgi:hypothetical protein